MDDNRKQDTRELIRKVFAQSYLKGGLRGITVKQICMQTPIARTTFYFYYDDLYAVLDEIIEYMIDGIYQINESFRYFDFSDYRKGKKEKAKLHLKETLDFIQSNHLYFLALVNNSENTFIFRWKQIIKRHFREKYQEEHIHTNNLELVLEMIASELIGSYTYWANNMAQITLEDFMEAHMKRVLIDFLE